MAQPYTDIRTDRIIIANEFLRYETSKKLQLHSYRRVIA